jgi:bacterioferritin-associated ferredoxin
MPNEDTIYICRCEEVTIELVREWIARGYDTPEELKRVTRIGMGPCQGRGCTDMLVREIARMKGIDVNEVKAPSFRPPAKPVKIGLLVDYRKDGGGR